MRRTIIVIFCVCVSLIANAQSVYDDINGYKQYLGNLMTLSEANHKRIDEQQVQAEAATKQNPQRYIDYMVIRYEHTEYLIQANIYLHCLGTAEELKAYSTDPVVADAISKFNATAELAKDRTQELAASEEKHEQQFQLDYGYPELVNISNYLAEDERELAEKYGLIVKFDE